MSKKSALPKSSLPTWDECAQRIDNEDALKDSNPEENDKHEDILLPNEIHRFIYEYDEIDESYSARLRHRLEKLIEFVKADSTAELVRQLADLKMQAEFHKSIYEEHHDAIVVALKVNKENAVLKQQNSDLKATLDRVLGEGNEN